MIRRTHWCSAACLTLAAMVLLGGCDDDPTEPNLPPLTGDFSVTGDTIGIQEPIRIVFNRTINPATALDPANFVVTNLCDTLRVPGSVRLSGDTLVFSPSEALPFLSVLSIRVQNILDVDGNALPQPITFQRIVQPPSVSDVSWSFLNSPTNDAISGISFSDPDVGYVATSAGSVYRTVNGGLTFGARFKDADITQAFNIQTFSGDTVLFLGAFLTGGSPQWAVFLSVDSALSFVPSNAANRLLYRSQVRNVGGSIVGVVGGQGSSPGLYRYNLATNGLTQASGAPGGGNLLTDVSLSPDGTKAVASFYNTTTNVGVAHLSVDSGLSYAPLALPLGVYRLFGTGFVDDATALLLGDSSTVLRVDVASGQVTPLGIAEGIPQTEVIGAATTAFTFRRARFTPDGLIGWITGVVTRHQPGSADVIQGVILQSRNGGQTWTRQAIEGAPDNGLGFSPISSLQALSSDFAAIGGLNGLIAARTDDSAPAAEACSFSQ